MPELEARIAEHPFGKGLPAWMIRRLAEAAQGMSPVAGEVLFHEGGPAGHLYLLQQGRVALESTVPGRGPTTFKILDAGEAIGWSWLVPPHRWQFTARAVAPCEITAVPAVALRRLAEESPEFGRELVDRMAAVLLVRLEATRQKLQEFHAPALARQEVHREEA